MSLTTSDSDIDVEQLRYALSQVIHGCRSNIAVFVAEKESAEEALSQLEGEAFEHYKETIKMYDNEILFNQKKLESAKNKLAQLG